MFTQILNLSFPLVSLCVGPQDEKNQVLMTNAWLQLVSTDSKKTFLNIPLYSSHLQHCKN